VASGGAVPWLNKAVRGESARLSITAKGWDGFTTALGAGPRLLKNGAIDVTALRENFRTDVRVGTGPRTAVGIDKEGCLIFLVADGRQQDYSTGLTLTETASILQQLGAVDAINLDGGGSTAIAINGRLANHPSDGSERRVANSLLVVRQYGEH
jgi:exopolysaccharide biosynthesis protein